MPVQKLSKQQKLKILLVIGLWLLAFLLIYEVFFARYAAADVSTLRLPPGFHISIYAHVPNARQMALSPKGTLFVGTRIDHGNVYAVSAAKNEANGERDVFVIAKDLFLPNGVAFRDGSLYIATINSVFRLDNIEQRLQDPPAPTLVNNGFPSATHHGWKYIRFGPDGYLYVPVGAPCNVCDRSDDMRFASIMRLKVGETDKEQQGKSGQSAQPTEKPELFASGIRNTVGFDWHPQTKQLWFTDNGRDWLGDNLPPDELNHAPKKGMHFGFPFRYGNNVPDPEFGKKESEDSKFTAPDVCLDPHVAAIGMRFYTGKMFPPEYRNRIFIAEHGSWNRSVPIGYRVMMVSFETGKPPRYEPFIEGWLTSTRICWGRPVDIELMPDGSMLISDDHAGLIYRVTYSGK